MKNERYLKKDSTQKNSSLAVQFFLVRYRKYGGTVKTNTLSNAMDNFDSEKSVNVKPMFGFRSFVLNVEYIHFH